MTEYIPIHTKLISEIEKLQESVDILLYYFMHRGNKNNKSVRQSMHPMLFLFDNEELYVERKEKLLRLITQLNNYKHLLETSEARLGMILDEINESTEKSSSRLCKSICNGHY